MGKIFVNPKTGHQLNQHYLDSIFPLDPTKRFTREPRDGDFMNMDSSAATGDNRVINKQGISGRAYSEQKGVLEKELTTTSPGVNLEEVTLGGIATYSLNNCIERKDRECDGKVEKMYHISRLWKYRNGGCP
jgi:hypothetical protein